MTQPELRAERLGYVHLGVEDIERSLAFWTEAVPLEVAARSGERVYLRGGMQHHWIVLEPAAEPGLKRVALEVADRGTLDAFEIHLRAQGVAVEAGDGLASDRVDRYLRFADPGGNPLELYCDMVAMGTPPRPRTVQLLDIQHVVLMCPDAREAAAFYCDLLGFRPSDWVERDMVFMHMRNGWHHGIGVGGFGPGARRRMAHSCSASSSLVVDARCSARRRPPRRHRWPPRYPCQWRRRRLEASARERPSLWRTRRSRWWAGERGSGASRAAARALRTQRRRGPRRSA